ncbi:hypothetical protein ACH41E_17300 [Streptomyces sp. NPDC020412]|uniref:hypothetical protein n=1 Tax=Streptomyces sp. NPDC020412 TaxID=3365073 RepID=UPI0037AAABBB
MSEGEQPIDVEGAAQGRAGRGGRDPRGARPGADRRGRRAGMILLRCYLLLVKAVRLGTG